MKYYEVHFRISAPQELANDVNDVVASLAGEAGFESFEETADGLKGYVQQALFDEETLAQLMTLLPFDESLVHVDYTVAETADRDWNEAWEKEGFDPIDIDGHIIIYDGRHMPPTLHPSSLAVQIDAHLAFGTGTHETTRMMASALARCVRKGCSVLDCGTGTGILSIVALLLGADSAVGYDIDEWSVTNALHNATLNGVEQRFTSLLGDSTVIDTLGKTFDIVVANINRNILLADMPRMSQAIKADSGKLLLSGFYRADIPLLVERAASLNLHLAGEYNEGEWSCLEFNKE